MTAKRNAFAAQRPSGGTKRLSPDADVWVGAANEGGEGVSRPVAEPLKRLTLDIPSSLHREIKRQTADRGTKMVEEIRQLLEDKYRNG